MSESESLVLSTLSVPRFRSILPKKIVQQTNVQPIQLVKRRKIEKRQKTADQEINSIKAMSTESDNDSINSEEFVNVNRNREN